MDLFVEATRSHSCWIKASFVVCGSNYHYIFVFIKTIHLCQDLVESRPAWAVLARTLSSLTWEQTVNFVNEYYTWRVFSCLFEQLSNSLRSYANKHFVKVRSGAEDKIASCFACNRPRQQRLASAWLSKEHHSFVQVSTFVSVLFGVLEYLDNVDDLFFDFIYALHIVEALT